MLLDTSDLWVNGRGLNDFLSLPFQRLIDLKVCRLLSRLLLWEASGESSMSMLWFVVPTSLSILDLLVRSRELAPDFSYVRYRLVIAFRLTRWPPLGGVAVLFSIWSVSVWTMLEGESSYLYRSAFL